MINSKTWHSDPNKQKCFVWTAINDGIELHHTTKKSSYIIPWPVFYSVIRCANELASGKSNIVTAGTSMTSPATGSVGAWVAQEKFKTSRGKLTPRHLSFLGPIYGHMGFISRQLNGNSIQWKFNH